MLTNSEFLVKGDGPANVKAARDFLVKEGYSHDFNGIYTKLDSMEELGESVAILTCEGLIIFTYAKWINY